MKNNNTLVCDFCLAAIKGDYTELVFIDDSKSHICHENDCTLSIDSRNVKHAYRLNTMKTRTSEELLISELNSIFYETYGCASYNPIERIKAESLQTTDPTNSVIGIIYHLDVIVQTDLFLFAGTKNFRFIGVSTNSGGTLSLLYSKKEA